MGTWQYEIQRNGDRVGKKRCRNKVMGTRGKHYNTAEPVGRARRRLRPW